MAPSAFLSTSEMSAPVLPARCRVRSATKQRCPAHHELQAGQTQLVQQAHPGRAGAEVRASAICEGALALPLTPMNVQTDRAFEAVQFEQAQAGAPPVSRTAKRTMAEILALSIPALGSVLADPVTSLVDTALIGQVSSTQLAALSPCTAIFNLVFLVRFNTFSVLQHSA